MNALLLCCLVLGAPTAYGIWTQLEQTCLRQEWEDEMDSTQWNECTNTWNGTRGRSAVSFDKALKDKYIKIIDSFIKLENGTGPEAAVLCDVRLYGAVIEAFWVTKAGEEEIETFAIGDADGNKQRVRFGIRAAKGKPGPYARLEIYGSKVPHELPLLPKPFVMCAAGRFGQVCDSFPGARDSGLHIWPTELDIARN